MVKVICYSLCQVLIDNISGLTVTAGFQPARCPTSEEFAAWTHTSCCYFKRCFICVWTFCFSLIADSFAEKLTSEMLFLVNLSALVWSNVSSLSICYILTATRVHLPLNCHHGIGLRSDIHQFFCFSFIFYIFLLWLRVLMTPSAFHCTLNSVIVWYPVASQYHW